jgi:hypothetical protein
MAPFAVSPGGIFVLIAIVLIAVVFVAIARDLPDRDTPAAVSTPI